MNTQIKQNKMNEGQHKHLNRTPSNASDISMNSAKSDGKPLSTNGSVQSGPSETKFDIDEIINELVQVQHRPPGTLVNLELQKIKWLI
jgi:hypothetical protein